MGILVMFLTFVVSSFAFSQIFGSIIYKLIMQKRFEHIITIIIWVAVLYGYYLIIVNNFNSYFSFYKFSTIIAAGITFFTIRDEKH